MARDAERTAVLIVRAWLEPDHPSPLRAVLTCTPDVEDEEATQRVVGSVDDACDAVRDWLEELLEDA